MIAPCWRCKGRSREALARLAPEVASMRFMDARMLAIGVQRLPRDPVGLHRRGRLRDQRCRLGSGAARARCFWTMRPLRRPVSAPATACGSRPACAFMARISTSSTTPVEAALEWAIQKVRRPRRRARRRISRRGRDIARARRRSAAAPGRPASHDRTPVRGGALLFAELPRPSPSARSHPAASDLRRPVRSPWVTCRTPQSAPGTTLVCGGTRQARAGRGDATCRSFRTRYKRTN